MVKDVNLNKYNNTFPTRLRALINKHNTTITALAKYVGISRQAVSQYQDGTTQPNVDTIIKIAEYFKVSTDYLLGISDYLTTNNEVKFVCEYTGLDEETINYFHSCVLKSNENSSVDIMPSLMFIDILSKEIAINPAIELYLNNIRKVSKKYIQSLDKIPINEIFNNRLKYLDENLNDIEEDVTFEYILNGAKYKISQIINSVIDDFSTYQIEEYDKYKMQTYSNKIYLFNKEDQE